MYKSSFGAIFFALVTLLAGQVYALDIALNAGGITTVPATQFLNVSDTSLQGACADSCQPGNDAISTCSDDQCLCSNQTVVQITSCVQCYFTELIRENRPIPGGDIRAGGQTALTAYASACLGAVHTPVATSLTALVVPPGWDGPFEFDLNVGATAVTLIAALITGVGCIGVLLVM